jgi:PPOX class probable F420-dependent enzyme
MKREIPASHRDLLTRPVHGVLTTILPDGQPQSTLVWVDYDGECALVNTTRERQKGRNLAANREVSLLVVDPEDTGRYLQIRGDAELLEDGALEHIDRLAHKYRRYSKYYGYVVPQEQQRRETRVVCRIQTLATCDGIHR